MSFVLSTDMETIIHITLLYLYGSWNMWNV